MTTRLRILVAAGLPGDEGRALARGVQLAGAIGGDLTVAAASEIDVSTLRRQLLALGASETTRVLPLVGAALEAVATIATDWRADLLIIDHAIASDHSLDLLTATAACPILVAREQRPRPYRKVLVGAGLSASSRRALEAALVISPTAHVTLLRVVNFPGGYVPDSLPDSPCDDEMEAILGDLVLPEQDHEWLVRFGKIKGEIVFAAREAKADLVALGIAQHVGLKRMLLGCVTMEVIASLSCDVVVGYRGDLRS